MCSYHKPKDAGKLLNKGYYTKVYENQKNPDAVFLFSNCRVKQAISEIGLNTDLNYFPEITKINHNDFCNYCGYYHHWYSTKKYLTGIKALHNFNEKALKKYRALLKLKKHNYESNKDTVLNAIKTLEADFPLFYQEIINAYYQLTNYSCSVSLDVALRNLGCNENGDLILLDIFIA